LRCRRAWRGRLAEAKTIEARGIGDAGCNLSVPARRLRPMQGCWRCHAQEKPGAASLACSTPRRRSSALKAMIFIIQCSMIGQYAFNLQETTLSRQTGA
jgi:hypothetical protein